MHLHIEHFAKLSNVDIDFDGLTVIAGANNTGKSTIGKILYSIYRSLSHIDIRIEKERCREVREAFSPIGLSANLSEADVLSLLHGTTTAKDILEAYLASLTSIKETAKESTQNLNAFYAQVLKSQFSDWKAKIENMIDDARQISDERVIAVILRRVFDCVFHSQYNPLFNVATDSYISLEIKDIVNKIHFSNEKASVSFGTPFYAYAHLITNPDVLSFLNVRDLELNNNYSKLLDKYVYELAVSLLNGKMQTVIHEAKDDTIKRKSLDILNGTLHGDFQLNTNGEIVFKENDNMQATKVENLSMGIKSLALLKRMIELNVLNRQDVLILDEPEIHLHPEWQLIYAQALVKLQQELELTILVTTHSPYFLKALHVYSQQEGISNKTRFYFAHSLKGNDLCACDDCTENINRIFQSLYEPFEELM